MERFHRYHDFWMPLIADLTLPYSSPPTILPPLDIHWVWFCHTLNPVSSLSLKNIYIFFKKSKIYSVFNDVLLWNWLVLLCFDSSVCSCVMWLVIEKQILKIKCWSDMGCIKLSYVINISIIYFDYVLFICFVIFLCDNSLPMCYLCLDPMMISNLVFVEAYD